MKKFLSLLLIFVLILTGGVLAHTVKVRVNGIDLQMTTNGGSGVTVESKVPDINGWSATGITLTNEQQHSTSVNFTMPDNPVELEATIQRSLITYDANGGTGAPASQTKSLGVDLILSTLEPTMVGRTFIEWNTMANGSGTRYMPGDTYSLDADLTLYAQWSGAVNFTWDTTGQLSKSINVKTTGATTINWGDGTIANVSSSPSSLLTLSHTYASAGDYTVRIQDDVVTLLDCANNNVIDLDVSSATNLTVLGCGWNALTSIDVSNNTALTWFECAGNDIEQLDVSNNVELIFLGCGENNLSSLDISNNMALTSLNCSGNTLTSLDVSNNTNLVDFLCYNNQLTSLDVSNNTLLTQMQCYSNNLNSLDVSNNLSLTTLQCSQATMNILVKDSRQSFTPGKHANTKVVTLTQTEGGKITYDKNYKFNITPDVGSQVISVTAGGIAQTPATTYDFVSLANDTTLTATFGTTYTVTFDANGGTGAPDPQAKLYDVNLILSNTAPTRNGYAFAGWNTAQDGNGTAYQPGATYSNDASITLYAQWAKIVFTWDTTDQLSKSIAVTTNGASTINWGDGTVENVESDPISGFVLSHTYTSAGNYTVGIVDNVVTHLNCSSEKVTGLDVSNNVALTSLYCNMNQLTNLNVSNNITLTSLECYSNQLTSLDVSNNTALASLKCYSNQLTSLDVSNNTALTYLHCGNNQLTSLDVSNNTALTQLWFNVNQLTSLDISNNTALTYLYCGNNQLTSLDVSNNTALTYLSCSNNQLTSLDVSNNLLLTTLTCSQSTMNILVKDSRQSVTPNKHANTKVVTVTQTPYGRIQYNSGYKFNIIPDAGYAIATLTAGGVSQTPNATYDFGTLTADKTLTATFTSVGVGSYVAYEGGYYNGDWVVLKNTNGQLEIISKNSVGTITLDGMNGYANAVKILNDKAKEYLNYNYATSARSIGANSKSIEQIDTNIYPVTYAAARTQTLPYHDTYHTDDVSIIANNSALQHGTTNTYNNNGYVWLASRDLLADDEFSEFSVRVLGSSGNVLLDDIFFESSNNDVNSYSASCGVRPVITLRSDLRIISGAGTQANPYILGIPHESVPVGTYIAYEGGDYDGDWVVLRDTPVGLEIISKESVGTLALEGADDYANAVRILNNKSREYVNYNYAVTGRSVGGTGRSIEKIDTTQYPITYTDVYPDLPYYDDYCDDDQAIIANNANLRHSSDWVWLASRYLYAASNIHVLGVNVLLPNSNTNTCPLVCTYSNSPELDDEGDLCGVRPVITLRGDMEITGGSGSQGDPYTIGAKERRVAEIGSYVVYNGGDGTKDITVEGITNGQIVVKEVGSASTTPLPSNLEVIGGSGLQSDPYRLGIPKDKIEVGSYVAYEGGDYNGDWVVLRNKAGEIEIISKESVGNLTLSGANGYASAVAKLNNKAKEYINPYYAVKGRSVGATDDSIEVINTSTYPLTYAAARNRELPYYDEYYTDDQTLIANNANLKHSIGHVWLASRILIAESDYSAFAGRFLMSSGDKNNDWLFMANSGGGTDTYSFSYGVRPVITLRGDIQIIGGSGTQADPYILGIPHKSIPVGTYVSYSGGNYAGKWVVLKDTNLGVEIISKESVGQLPIAGPTGFANLVRLLNDKSRQYLNPTYAVSARSVGSSGRSIEMINTSDYPMTWGNIGQNLPYYDEYYEDDATIIANNAALQHSQGVEMCVALASRNAQLSNYAMLWERTLYHNGATDDDFMLGSVSNTNVVQSYSVAIGVRPVIMLRSSARITGGSGTSGSPYTLGF